MLPLVRLSGSPREQGRTHGRALRGAIESNVALYIRRFEAEVGLAPKEALRRAALYGDAIARENPRYFEEMTGVAEGAGIALDEAVMLSVRYELLYDRFGSASAGPERDRRDGCTAFVVLPERSADGHLRLGQNWDWIPEVRCALLRRTGEVGLESLAFTEAGIPGGKIGMNARGMAFGINGLGSLADDWSTRRVPFHVRCDEALRSSGLDEAVSAITRGARSCSANFVLAEAPDRALDLETAPEALCALGAEGGLLVHTNHFLDPAVLGVEVPLEEVHARSCERRERMLALLSSRESIALEDLRRFLADHDGHPHSICGHPDPALPELERYATVVSIVMDLTALEMSVCDGPPCRGRFDRISLA